MKTNTVTLGLSNNHKFTFESALNIASIQRTYCIGNELHSKDELLTVESVTVH